MDSQHPRFQKPQGIAYVPALNKVFVASGDDGMLRVFRGDRLELVDSIKLDLGPNRITYDPQTKLLYVGYGGTDAGKEYGEVAIIDAKINKRTGEVQVIAHPSELLLNKSGRTLNVFVSIASQIQLVDTRKLQVLATWPVSSQRNGDGAIDEAAHRLLIGTRTPPQMIAMDSDSGKEVAALPTVEGKYARC
jgi:DNA-binding beta-propeller fold protein YncE